MHIKNSFGISLILVFLTYVLEAILGRFSDNPYFGFGLFLMLPFYVLIVWAIIFFIFETFDKQRRILSKISLTISFIALTIIVSLIIMYRMF